MATRYSGRRFAADVGGRKRSRKPPRYNPIEGIRAAKRDWDRQLAESLTRDDITLNPLWRALKGLA